MWCQTRRRFVTPVNIYIDDLIVRLSNSGFGAYIGNVMYADDIALISVNCRGLSKMLEICEAYDIGCVF